MIVLIIIGILLFVYGLLSLIDIVGVLDVSDYSVIKEVLYNFLAIYTKYPDKFTEHLSHITKNETSRDYSEIGMKIVIIGRIAKTVCAIFVWLLLMICAPVLLLGSYALLTIAYVGCITGFIIYTIFETIRECLCVKKEKRNYKRIWSWLNRS